MSSQRVPICTKCTKTISASAVECASQICNKKFHPACAKYYIKTKNAASCCKASFSSLSSGDPNQSSILDNPISPNSMDFFTFDSSNSSANRSPLVTLSTSVPSSQDLDSTRVQFPPEISVTTNPNSSVTLDSLGAALQQLLQNQNNAEQRLSQRLTGIESSLTEFKKKQEAVDSKLNLAINEMARISSVITSHDSRISTLESGADSFKASLSVLESGAHSLNEGLTSLKAEVAALKSVASHPPLASSPTVSGSSSSTTDSTEFIISGIPALVTTSPLEIAQHVVSMLGINNVSNGLLTARVYD